MCCILGRGLLETLTKENGTGRVVKRLERVRMGQVLDFENGKKWGASEILF